MFQFLLVTRCAAKTFNRFFPCVFGLWFRVELPVPGPKISFQGPSRNALDRVPLITRFLRCEFPGFFRTASKLEESGACFFKSLICAMSAHVAIKSFIPISASLTLPGLMNPGQTAANGILSHLQKQKTCSLARCRLNGVRLFPFPAFGWRLLQVDVPSSGLSHDPMRP